MNHRQGFRQAFSGQEFLHLLALNAFAVVGPILDRLAENASYLWRRSISTFDVIALVVILLTTIPVVGSLIISVLRWRGFVRSAAVVLKSLLGVLFLMSLLIATRWLSATLALGDVGVPQSLLALVAVGASALAVWLYSRYDTIRLTLALCATGVLLFPMSFFLAPAIQEQVFGISQQKITPISISNPAPVLMIVFDGLSGMALLDENHTIDRVRYPAFARLADISNFYRNTTTVHTRTDHALPAILCSTTPSESRQPVEANYPTSLFRLIHRTQQYKFTVAEPVSNFYSALDIPKPRMHSRSLTQIGPLLSTLLKVYINISLPQEITSDAVAIPKDWFGMGKFRTSDLVQADDGQMMFGWDTEREVQCEQFVRSIMPTEKPAFRFLHVVVPHDPWDLLPSGKSYVRYGIYVDEIIGSDHEIWTTDEWLVNQGWQRYLLQLQFADRTLGRILDRLESTGQFDKSLIVVTADHGMAFVPGFSRRAPSAETLPDIASVPLIIKQPFQKQSEISDRNAETIDISPTIADVLGIPLDGAWEGQSLLSGAPERPRKTLISPPDTIVLEADFPQRFRYVDRMMQVFGTGSNADRLTKLYAAPDLIGIETSALEIGNSATFTSDLFQGGSDFDPSLPNYIPCYQRGHLSVSADETSPRVLAVSLNGIILATTQTSTDPEHHGHWSAMLPEAAFLQAGNHVQLFEVERHSDRFVLHEIELKPFPS